MKLTPRDLGGFLAAPSKYRAVLIYGPDDGLIRERRKIILDKVSDPSDPFGLIELPSDQVEKEPQKLFEALASFSLLGSVPSIWLRDAGAKVAPILLEAMAQPKGNFLVVTAGDLDSRGALRKLFEDTADLAALPCYTDEGETIEKVARGFFTKHGIRCEPEVLAYLRQHLGNDRGVTLSELEKIALYLGEDKVLTPELVEQLVAENSLLALDDLAHAVAEGDLKRLHPVAERLLQEEGQPITLLRACVRYLDRLLAAKSQMALGKNADQAMMSLRPPVFFKEKDRMRRLLSRRSTAQLEAMLARLLAAERACKRTGDQSLTCLHALAETARL